MKKTILATSIMFSTLVLGTNVLVDSTTKVLAINTEQSKATNDKGIVQNKIRFIEEDGAYVENDDGNTITTYTGKKGDVIDLKIPSGYSLGNLNEKYYFENTDSIKEIVVTPQEIQNTIIFKNDGNETVGNIQISGKTNTKYQISKLQPPTGYYLGFNFWDTITFSALNKEHTIYVTDKQKVTNIVIFVDENGKEIKRDEITGRIGSRVNISDTSFEYDEYKLSPNQSENIVLKENNSEIKVNVVSNKKSNKLIFKDSKGKVISEKTISGGIGRSFMLHDFLPDGYYFLNGQDYQVTIEKDNAVREYTVVKSEIKNKLVFKDSKGNIIGEKIISGKNGSQFYVNQYLPNDYSLANDQERYMDFQDDESIIEIKVHKTKIMNKLIFKDENGKEIKKADFEGEYNEQYYIDDYLPEDYDFVNYDDRNLELKDDGSVIEIKVKKVYAKNLLIFRDTNGKIIHQEEVRGTIGETNYAYRYVPKGYHVKGDKSFVTDDKGTKFEFVIISDELSGYFSNYISYINEKGEEVERYPISGEYDDEITVNELNGYQLLSNKKIKIKTKNGYVHKILVKALSVKSKLTLVDYFTDEILETVELTQLNGTKITNNQIPNKYRIPSAHEHYVNANHLDQKIKVKRVVKTNINFIDSKGKGIDSQKEETLDKDTIKLKLPKGYKQATGNGHIMADYRSDNYNVLVVPTGESVDKPTVSKPGPKPTPNPAPKPQPGQANKDSVTTQVNFVDKTTKQKVHTYSVQGKHGQTVEIKVPTEYELSDASNSKLTLDKSKKSVDIYVVKKKNSSSATQTYNATVLTKKTVSLFDKNGKLINNRALGFNSSWRVNQKLTHHGETYYRVATNEYVKTQDVVEYQPVNSAIQTKVGGYKSLYDINGKKNGNRALAAKTAWFTDRSANINGEKMYRVATNEWVKAIDIM